MSQAPKTPNPTPSSADLNGSNRQDVQYMNRARASIRQAQSFYSQYRRSRQQSMDVKQLAAMQAQLDRLSATLERLDGGMIRIAAFGLVSRGKSTVLNSLMGQRILTTGPIHGVTQWPRSVQWDVGGNLAVELIDTPGLDEVEGQVRSEMARNIAGAADLILFVVSGDITRTEYEALCELRRTQKPLILVFNKIDLYPEQDRQAIYRQLQYFASAKQKRKQAEVGIEDDWVEVDQTKGDRLPHQEDIVMVAADPSPLQVRIEWPDGRVSYELETPLPQIEQLKDKILQVVQEQGRSLLAINALVQAKEAQEELAKASIKSRQEQAETLIWRFAQYKAAAVALNPLALFDVLGGAIADLLLIRALARLYGLPMTGYEAGKLWQQILFSSGGVLLSELANGLFMGFGKSAAAIIGASGDVGGMTGYVGAAIAQASVAGFGTYKVGQAAQVYLEQGCTWGPLGANTVIQDILSQVEPNTVLYRLREELQQQLEVKS